MLLVLGGTIEGRRLAEALVERGVDAVLSLARRTTRPLVAGETRAGGFGGPDGLARYLRDEGVDAVIDATHPFADQMTRHAAEACRRVGVALLRLSRPGWEHHPLARTWHWVDSHDQGADAAATLAADHPGVVLLTVGRQPTPEYLPALAEHAVIARMAEPLGVDVPNGWRVLIDRGPFSLDDERALLRDERVSVLVSKNSGGASTEAKLDAAAEAGVRVVMVHRPAVPEGVEVVSSVTEALAWIDGLASSKSSPAT